MTVFSRLRLVVSASFFGLSLISGEAQVAPSVAAGSQKVSALPAGVRPRINGPDGAVITTNNFGSVPVGGNASQDVTSPALNEGLTYTPVTGTDFQVGPVSCDTACTASVTFTPTLPGLRRGAILMRDSNNTVVGEAFVSGIGVSPQLGFDLGAQTDYGPDFIPKPAAVAIGPDGSLYYSDTSTNNVYKVRFLPGGPVKSLLGLTGLSGASISSIAVDGSNTVFLADVNSSTIISYTQIPTPNTDFSTSVQGVVATSPLSTPRAIAVDGAGSLFILDAGNGRILRINVLGVEAVIKTGLHNASGLNLDSRGNIFYADQDQGGEVVEIPAGEGTPIQVATSIGSQQTAVAVDPGGRVYVSFNGLLTVTPSKVTQGYGSFSSTPYNAQVASNGDLYTTNTTSHTLSTYTRATSSLTLTATAGASTSGNVTIENTGNAALHLDTFSVTGAEFTIDRTASSCKEDASVVAGETCFITVDFTAPAANVQESLVVTSDDGVTTASNTVTLYGPQASSSTALTYSPNFTVAGQPITLTATVTGATNVNRTGQIVAPTGTVQFMEGTTVLGTATLGTATDLLATATTTVTYPGPGSHAVFAVYSGATNLGASQSPVSRFTVSGGPTLPTTSTTLTVTPTASSYRAPVTLTAQVVFSGTDIVVAAGQVIFCDTAALSCNVLANLGLAQLNGSGIATLRLAPGTVDTHTYKAIFMGTSAAPSSTSATQTVMVSGTYPTVTSIMSTGSAGAYTLTGTVIGSGTRAVGPGGTVTFRDTTNTGSPVLGTMAVGAVAPSFVERPQTPLAVGTHPYGIATGDFNNDGFADIVTGNYDAASVSVLLGNGDGTFQAAVSYAVGRQPERVLVADFNGDGQPDLVVANTGSSTISILLGNPDGTFRTQVSYGAASPVGLGVLDLNHDGFADVVATDYYAGTISVLVGNGDGTLRTAVTYAAGTNPQTLTEGDLDGDGNIDLVAGNFGSNTVSVFLGNGDGTFKPQVTYAVGGQPQGVQLADLRGLGKLDLAVVNSQDNDIGVLQGNGDGTFVAQMVTYPTGVKPVGLVIADFNGDGFPDVTVSNTGGLSQSVLLGNGAGTFQPQSTYLMGDFPYGQAVADFNGDGTPDIAVSNFTVSTVTILQSQLLQTGTATLSNVALGGTPGTHNVIASYVGDTNFAATDSTAIQLISNGATTVASSVSLTMTPAAANVGQSVVFAVQVTSGTQLAVAPAGTVTLMAVGTTTVSLGTITIDGTGAGSLSNATLPAGTYQVTAIYGGSPLYAQSTSSPQTLTVSLATQTITFPAIVNHVSTDAQFALAATASSGLPVSYTVVSGPATVSGSTLTLTGTAGTVVVQASQAGNTTYAAATPVTRSFSATPPAVTLTGVSPASTVVGSGATTVTLIGMNFATGDVVSFNTTVLASTVVNATTLTAVIPAASLTTIGTGQISVKDPATQITSLSVTFTVTSKNVPTLASLTPAAAVAGAGATTVTVAGTNFTSKSTVQFNGAVIDSTYFDPKTIFATIPAALLKTAGTAQVTVTDPASAITTAALTFTISATPAIVFSGPSTAPSGQQPTLNFTLTNPYPVALSGTLGLTFVPASATPGADDPAVQFSAGGRSLNFTIPANSTVTPAVQLQTGTVAGIATAILNVFDPSGDNLTPSNVVPIVITIPAAIPTLTNVSLVRSGQTLNVVVSGFSNTREVSKAVFHFTAASGSSVDTPDVTADVTGLFAQWYGSAPSVPFGSTVIYTQTFNLDHDASSIGSVSVTLTNSIGVSTSASAQ